MDLPPGFPKIPVPPQPPQPANSGSIPPQPMPVPPPLPHPQSEPLYTFIEEEVEFENDPEEEVEELNEDIGRNLHGKRGRKHWKRKHGCPFSRIDFTNLSQEQAEIHMTQLITKVLFKCFMICTAILVVASALNVCVLNKIKRNLEIKEKYEVLHTPAFGINVYAPQQIQNESGYIARGNTIN